MNRLAALTASSLQGQETEDGDIIVPGNGMSAAGTPGARTNNRLLARYPVDAHVEETPQTAADEPPQQPQHPAIDGRSQGSLLTSTNLLHQRAAHGLNRRRATPPQPKRFGALV